jgi:hypothetical protein
MLCDHVGLDFVDVHFTGFSNCCKILLSKSLFAAAAAAGRVQR